jgi:hypothetical protein
VLVLKGNIKLTKLQPAPPAVLLLVMVMAPVALLVVTDEFGDET